MTEQRSNGIYYPHFFEPISLSLSLRVEKLDQALSHTYTQNRFTAVKLQAGILCRDQVQVYKEEEEEDDDDC